MLNGVGGVKATVLEAEVGATPYVADDAELWDGADIGPQEAEEDPIALLTGAENMDPLAAST